MDASLVVALVGVGGTLTGVWMTQVMQARAEKRRLHSEGQTRFHSARRAAYVAFLAHIGVQRKYLSDSVTYWDTPYMKRVRDQAPEPGEWIARSQEIMAEIHLVGDDSVIAASSQLLTAALAGPLGLYAPSAPLPTRDEVRERAKVAEQIYRDAYEPCLDAMRSSLGAPSLSRYPLL